MASGLFTLKQQAQALRQKAWTGAQKTNYVEYLVVAGGGSTGAYGGGGAGGLLQGITLVPNNQSISVTVGAGAYNANGSNSVFGSIIAIGGGAGAGGGGSGGSGGGIHNGGLGGQGVAGQGNKAGDSPIVYANYYIGSGGGGAGAPSVKVINTPTSGGVGIASAISGTVTTYAGGGSGGQAYYGDVILAGTAGGGAANGNSTNNYIGQNGTANTGGGAGGTSYSPGTNAGTPTGGSGIVIIRYPDIFSDAVSVTGGTKTTANGYTLYTFLTSGSITL